MTYRELPQLNESPLACTNDLCAGKNEPPPGHTYPPMFSIEVLVYESRRPTPHAFAGKKAEDFKCAYCHKPAVKKAVTT